MNRRQLIQSSVASAALIGFPAIRSVAHATTPDGTPSVTFAVDDVERGTRRLPTRPVADAIRAMASIPEGRLESWTRDVDAVIASPSDVHPLLSAVTMAYDRHYPLVLSPDMIWLQVLQGLASHVNANAEALRRHFVAHDGKVLVEIKRDDFRRGSPDNDWDGAFAEFSAGMRPHIGAQTHELVTAPFSTTGPVELAAFNVSLMDAMQNYFAFGMTTSCGFPEITLEGSVDDWTALRARAADLARFDLDWWIRALLPVLDQFVETAAGRPSKDFWCSFYKLQPVGSGTPFIHGHIVNLFPYFGRKSPTPERLLADFEVFARQTQFSGPRTEAQIQAEIARFKAGLDTNHPLQDTLRRNPFIGRTVMGPREGMTTQDINTVLNSAPMVWRYFGEDLQMQLLAGFVGATQDPDTLAIRPKIGWAVREGAA